MILGNDPLNYFNIVFDVQRYVHAVTIVGDGNSTHPEFGQVYAFFWSENWVVTVGHQTG
jgi:hypothetical protein